MGPGPVFLIFLTGVARTGTMLWVSLGIYASLCMYPGTMVGIHTPPSLYTTLPPWVYPHPTMLAGATSAAQRVSRVRNDEALGSTLRIVREMKPREALRLPDV